MKRLVILGGGESGVGTAILAKQKGFDVFVSDFGKIADNYKKVLIENQINFEHEKHTESLILNADLVMKSPGIPDKVAIVQQLIQKNIPIVSEIEFAFPYTNAKIIGITGSNGKTTTTMLCYHTLKTAGLNVGLGGNIGKSFAWQVATENFDIYVLEISSFQLDGCYHFRPDIAILTNISPDHLDRYDYDYQMYINSKFRITQAQTESDFLFYDDDDEASQNWLLTHKTKAKSIPFSVSKILDFGISINSKTMTIKLADDNYTMDTTHFSLEGKHNLKNAAAVSGVANMLKIRKDTIRKSMESFDGVPHRLEKTQKVNGVQYINDSKATNVNATFYALESLHAPTVWIVGGVDKGNDYMELMSFVREKVKAIICLGTDNQKIIEAFGNVVDIMVETESMIDAVKTASHIAEKNDVVLLSPCCASFDLFKNYEDRGNQFKEAVRNL